MKEKEKGLAMERVRVQEEDRGEGGEEFEGITGRREEEEIG